MTKPTDKDLANRVIAANFVVQNVSDGNPVTLDQCRAAVGDDGDLCLHLFMALQGHVTALGYAWDAAKTILNTPPIDGHHWFRRVEVIGQGQVVEILIGGARMRAEAGHEAPVMVAAALSDWARRAENVLQGVP